MTRAVNRQHTPPALQRLDTLMPLDGPARAAVTGAIARVRLVEPDQELLSEGQAITHTLLIVDGWAARVRVFPDGRRQILSFLLPGDLIGHCRQDSPCSVSTVIALTEVAICVAPRPAISPALAEAYAISTALDEAYLLAHIARLGRLTAHERICDLLLELLDRFQLSGLADAWAFELPLTQEKLADVLGLTAVHINRMLQLLRKEGELTLKGRQLVLTDPRGLAEKIGHITARVYAC
ncbi:Crp/Fnr family transcriptional regulator [Sphingomonas sp. PR090111-T3T-6A]|uniref:Crp/Fnr family transcriptional regulator n=1 Tax=Sphingomonas sp. PR090111-T3T-6A TaxID=685778 RepID=UPI00036042D5|nr:Crp/Fnr family transcriptional regulator [Sphingomonas sp. PR090111-T3T-6A]